MPRWPLSVADWGSLQSMALFERIKDRGGDRGAEPSQDLRAAIAIEELRGVPGGGAMGRFRLLPGGGVG